MKVYIGPYFGHTRRLLVNVIEKFGVEVEYEGVVYNFLESKPIKKVLESIDKVLFRAGHDQVVKVRIDYYDTWSLDHTLAQIIYPGLVQLRDVKHGCFVVDNEDLPEELRAPEGSDVFDMHFELMEKQTNWLFDEMIFAFRARAAQDDDDLEPKHPMELYRETVDNPLSMFDKDFVAPWSEEEYQKYHTDHLAYAIRVQRGLSFFGKYYSHLWD